MLFEEKPDKAVTQVSERSPVNIKVHIEISRLMRRDERKGSLRTKIRVVTNLRRTVLLYRISSAHKPQKRYGASHHGTIIFNHIVVPPRLDFYGQCL